MMMMMFLSFLPPTLIHSFLYLFVLRHRIDCIDNAVSNEEQVTRTTGSSLIAVSTGLWTGVVLSSRIYIPQISMRHENSLISHFNKIEKETKFPTSRDKKEPSKASHIPLRSAVVICLNLKVY